MNIIDKINSATSIWEIIPSLSAKELERAIKKAADSYYNSDISLISDSDFDALVDRLREINPKSPVLNKIGAPIKGKKVKLPYWMGSMDKIKTEQTLITKWTRNNPGPYIISDKLDGISCLLNIVDGEATLYTRGDGEYGQNISHLLDYVNMADDELYDLTKNIAIRGELIMPKNKFDKYSKIMANARNMVGGIVNSKPDKINKKHARDVDFVAYEIIEPILKPSQQFVTMDKWNLNVVRYEIYKKIDLTSLNILLEKRKKSSVYEIDGIIVTDDYLHTRNSSGNPTYSFAFKGLTESADVKVKKVIWEPSKDGRLIPRINFERVRLSQANLDYATGFNAKFIVNNGIGKGAIIRVTRSGDVIPHVTDIIKPTAPDLPIDYKYKWDDNEINFILVDMNKNETVIIKRLTKFVRDIGVENMSSGIINKLFDSGYNTIFKIISMSVDDFLSIDGFQEKLANKIYDNLNDALDRIDILTLMVASNIFGRGFGERKIKKILNVYPNIVDEYSKKTHDKWESKLLDLEGFDTISVGYFLDALPEFQNFYDKFDEIVEVKPYKSTVNVSGRFKDQNIVFTGFRNKDWQKIIENEGGRVSSGVSNNTSILVYKDDDTSSSKYLKAQKMGIKLISLSAFSKIMAKKN